MSRIGSLLDVKSILDQALAAGGGQLEFETHGKAVHWRHRAYTFRKAFAAELRPGELSPYDQLSFPKIPSDSSVVHITTHQTDAVFQPAVGGTPVALPPASVPDDDPLLDFAKQLAGSIEEDIL